MKIILLFLVGTAAGALITLQSVFNAGLGKRTGNLGSILLITMVSIILVTLLIVLFPKTASLRALPGPGDWYLYLGGLLGLGILAAPIFLVPQIGASPFIFPWMQNFTAISRSACLSATAPRKRRFAWASPPST